MVEMRETTGTDIAQITTTDFEGRLGGDTADELKPATLLLPVGSIEAHGPHCPLGTDVIIPTHLAKLVAGQLKGRAMVAPTIPYGHSWELSVFPGTINVPARVLTDYVAAVGANFAHQGFKNIALLNGHGGNIPALNHAAEDIAEEGVRVILISWWVDFSKEILTVCSSQGHGGEDETSVIMAIDPSLVKLERAKGLENWPDNRLRVKELGIGREILRGAITGNPGLASIGKGEAILETVSTAIAREINCITGRGTNCD